MSSHLAANQLEGNRKGRAVAECAEGDAVALGSAEERLAERMWPGWRPSERSDGRGRLADGTIRLHHVRPMT